MSWPGPTGPTGVAGRPSIVRSNPPTPEEISDALLDLDFSEVIKLIPLGTLLPDSFIAALDVKQAMKRHETEGQLEERIGRRVRKELKKR